MLLQAGEGATVVRASDARGAEKGCEIATEDICAKHFSRAKAQRRKENPQRKPLETR